MYLACGSKRPKGEKARAQIRTPCSSRFVADADVLVPQGAGNVFKDGEAEQAKHASNDSAVEEKQSESLAQKGMNLLGLGKKNDKQQATKS